MEDYAATLKRLEREFMAADRLTLTLATTGRLNYHNPVCGTLDDRQGILLSYALSSAARFASTWLNLNLGDPHTRLGRLAAADALAGEDLRYELPAVAAALRSPWAEALEARKQLWRLGAAVEDTALRLAPTWQLPLAQLPFAASAVAADPPDEMCERRRRATKG
jgi:hypothetical protein